MSQSEVIPNPSPGQRRPSRLFGQYIIKNRFQFKFSFMVFFFLTIAMVAIWLEGHWAVNQMIANEVVTSENGIAQLHLINKMILYTSFIAIAVIFGLSLFFSHFIAGPIYHFERIFQQMRDGDLSQIVRLRKKDEFQDTAKIFNEALSGLRTKLRAERESVTVFLSRIRKHAEKLKEQGKTEEAAEIEKIIFDLHNNPPQIKI